MSPKDRPRILIQYRFPILLSAVLLGAYLAYSKKDYFLQDIKTEAESLLKEDTKAERVVKKLKDEFHR